MVTDGQVEIQENEHTISPCPATGDSNVACIFGSRAAERRLSITRLRFIFACVRLPLAGNKYQERPRGGAAPRGQPTDTLSEGASVKQSPTIHPEPSSCIGRAAHPSELSHPFIGLRGVALAIALTAGPHRCEKYFSPRGGF